VKQLACNRCRKTPKTADDAFLFAFAATAQSSGDWFDRVARAADSLCVFVATEKFGGDRFEQIFFLLLLLFACVPSCLFVVMPTAGMRTCDVAVLP